MTRRARRAFVLPAALAGASLLCVGCSGPVHALRLNPTPEVMTLADTPDEASNKMWLSANMNARMINEDLARTFYLDRPTRLSNKPIPR